MLVSRLRIALLSDSQCGINFFPKLGEKLSGQIADAEIETHFVPSPEDLPLKAKELASSCDLIFVFSLYSEDKSRAEMVVEKLVDVETETGKKIVKAIEESELDDINTAEQLEEEKERLAEKWSSLIVKTLFKPGEVSPEEETREQFPIP